MNIKVKIFIIDVDGTLTDSGIYYDQEGNELKKFCTKDAAGIFAARSCGMKIMILTGRESNATKRRMEELGVDYLVQNIKDKAEYLEEFIKENGLLKEEVGYIGDDLNDIKAMLLAGFRACPSDACQEIKKISDYVSNINGGHGAVRDILEYFLKLYGKWENAIKNVYKLEDRSLNILH